MRRGFLMAEVLFAVFLVAMVISTVVALRATGHRALVLSEDCERLQRAVHALARQAADADFAELAAAAQAGGALDSAWLERAGADPRQVRARVEPTADPDVLRFVAEARANRATGLDPRVTCRRLVVRAEASLARTFPLEAR